MCAKWVWVNCNTEQAADQMVYLAVTGHLERFQLKARISPANPLSVDIELQDFSPDEVAEIRSKPWVVDAQPFPDNVPPPEDVPDAETIRGQFLAAHSIHL